MYEQGESFERKNLRADPQMEKGRQPSRFPPSSGEEHVGGEGGSMGEVGRKVQHEATDALKEEGAAIGNEVRHYIEDAAHSGKERIAERLHHVSEALHRAAETLQSEDEPTSGRFAGKAADQIDRVCNYLHNHDAGDLISEADRMARRQPAILIGGALVTGVLLARFLRSSQKQDSENDSQEQQNEQTQARGPGREVAEVRSPSSGTVPQSTLGGSLSESQQSPTHGTSPQPTRITPGQRPEGRTEGGPMEGGF